MNLRFRLSGSMLQRCDANASINARQPQTGRHGVAALALWAIVGAVFAAGCVTSTRAADPEFPDEWFFDQQDEMRSNLEGSLAIELSTDTWIGESTTLDACRGKVVVLDFWATWCGPCVAAIPKNIAMVDAHPDDLVFIGMHSETSGWDKAPQMVEDREINYPVVLDTGETGEAYGINAFPTYIIIDRTGIVRAAGVKPAHVKTIVEQLIDESGPANRGLQFAAFNRSWFYTGVERMRPWQEQLGQPAQPIRARAWWKPGDDRPSERQVARDSDTDDSETSDTEASDTEAGDTAGTDIVSDIPDGFNEADLDGVVRVLHFTRPGMAITQTQIKAINETAATYAPQGVTFVVVCDHQSDWSAAQAFASKEDLGVAMALDAAADPTKSAKDDEEDVNADTTDAAAQPREAGRTAQSYHVRVAPVTVVIDRKGRIRATGLKIEQLGDALNMLLSEQAG